MCFSWLALAIVDKLVVIVWYFLFSTLDLYTGIWCWYVCPPDPPTTLFLQLALLIKMIKFNPSPLIAADWSLCNCLYYNQLWGFSFQHFRFLIVYCLAMQWWLSGSTQGTPLKCKTGVVFEHVVCFHCKRACILGMGKTGRPSHILTFECSHIIPRWFECIFSFAEISELM